MLAVDDTHQDAFEDIRAAVRELCSRFPGEYWRALDRDSYLTEYVLDLPRSY